MTDCPFCNFDHSISKHIWAYEHWNLFLHSDKKRAEIRQVAGLVASKEHVEKPEDASAEVWAELQRIISDASERLCKAVGVTYVGQEAVGFNQGELIGQTVKHAHVHIFPVAEEDPEELKGRAGMGAAFEALRREKLN